MSSSPMEVVLKYPMAGRVRCPRCWGNEDPSLKTRGDFSDAAHLAKHLKAKHPGDTIGYACGSCRFKGTGRYPLKSVRTHYEGEHGGHQDASPAPGPSTRTASSSPTARVGLSGARTAVNSPPATRSTARAARASRPAAAAPSLATATTRTTTTTRSPSYAAVTAAPARPTGTTARTSTAAGSATRRNAAATAVRQRTPPTTGVTGGVRRRPPVAVPVCSACGMPATQPSPPSAARTARGPPPSSRTSGGSGGGRKGAPSEKTRRDGAARPVRRSPQGTSDERRPPVQSPPHVAAGLTARTPPQQTRAACAPAAKSPAERTAASRGSEKSSRSPRTATRRHTARETSQFVVQPSGTWARGFRSPTPPSSPEGFTDIQAAGSMARRPKPAAPTAAAAPRPATIAATSSPATLVTCTVTTAVCGAPVMSTGCPAVTTAAPERTWGRPQLRRNRPTPPSAAIPPPSPAVASAGERCPTSEGPTPPPGPQDERRPTVATSPPPATSEGDESGGSGSWSVSRRRRTRRRLRTASLESTPSRDAPAEVRASPGPPPVTLANYPPLPSSSSAAAVPRLSLEAADDIEAAVARAVDAIRRGIASPGDRADEPEPAPVRAVDAVPAPPAAPLDVRGVMGRRRGPASVVGAGDDGERASASRGRGAHQRPPRRADVQLGEPYRGPRATRDELARLADAVATPVDLEELAVRAARYFRESVADRGAADAPGARDRTVRSRGAAARRRDWANAPAGDGAIAAGPAPAGARGGPQGERRGNRTREATRIQALYRRNRRKAVREVIQGPADFCQVQSRTVQEYFERLYCGGEVLDRLGAAERVDPERQQDIDRLLGPFTEGEVERRLRRMTNSAPGPDGLTYNDLRAADPGVRLLTSFFNACLRLEAVPPSWKTSNTVLVYKKGDRADLNNWRPLALGDTMPKLFAALAADRLTDWAVTGNKLSRAQKGFLRDEGCYEHNFVLQEILTDARRTRREAVVAWLDLSNAFGSVPHAAIRRALVRAGVPSGFIRVWGSMYDGCTTRVRTVDGFTAPIPIRSGVRQGCPLSPIIFNLAVDSVVRAAADIDGTGYGLHGHLFNILAYADDIALIASTPEGMRRLLTAVEVEATSIGLHFNPAKCATLHHVARAAGRVEPTVFTIEGRPIPTLADGEPYKHLGVPTGSSVCQTPFDTIEGMLRDLRAVDASLLAPWQRVEVLASFVLPRMDFLLRGAAVEKRPLKAVDLQVRRVVKSWLNLPQRASAEVVYIPPSRGGCGLLPLSDLADVLTIAHAFRMLTARDAVVGALAWGSLRGVVARRVGHAPDCDEIASFLSGSLEGRMRGGGEASLWSRARNAARRQADRAAIRWRWSQATEEMIVECRGSGGRTVKIPGSARPQVIHRLRSAVAEYYSGTLLRKPDQGKVFEVSSRIPVSNHFVRGGSFTRFADWRFIHRARLDVLPLNGARRWGDGDVRCRRCGGAAETLPHVLGHCGVHAAAIQLRHDAVLHRLRRACRLPGDVRVNQRVEGINGELGGLRPDLVVRHEPSKSVVVCDVTVPFENRSVAFEEARARKIAKYSPLAEALQAQGYRVVVTALVVGALGSWDPGNDAVLSLLRVGGAYGAMMRRLIVSDTIRWSRDIYVEHVSGVRQYPAPARPPGDDGPEATPPRAIRRRWPNVAAHQQHVL